MPKSVILMLVLGILVFLAAAYVLFSPSTQGVPLSVENTPASEAEFTFITLTAQIDPVSFTPDVLSDPRFLALEDIRTLIVPEAAGRPDPFAPIPGVAAE